MYDFYILDRDFGPGFIKICTYFPVRHETGWVARTHRWPVAVRR
jgi:hypothetical protein